MICLLMPAFLAGGILLIIALFASFIVGTEIGFMPLIAQIIIGLAVGATFVGTLTVSFKANKPLKFLDKHMHRKAVRKAIAQTEHQQSEAKQRLKDFSESEVYRAAEHRNALAYEADCRLAEKWQENWYQQFKNKAGDMYI